MIWRIPITLCHRSDVITRRKRTCNGSESL